MSLHLVFPDQYQQQLDDKLSWLASLLTEAGLTLPEPQVFESPKEHYRMRAEFKIWQQEGTAYYAMHEPGQKNKAYIIEEFPVACKRINELMAPLLAFINGDSVLQERLFQLEFLSTLSKDTLVTMIYHKPLGQDWQLRAEALAQALGVKIIGRSRKQKLVLAQDYVQEQLTVGDQIFSYQQVEGSFTQPNAKVCEKMLWWACQQSEALGGDLLELYCGNGNFTIPLSKRFDKVLATEISKTSVRSALANFDQNEIKNADIVRMSSEEFTQAMDGVRKFQRLREINLDDFDFSTIFVDPPRAGLDEGTEKLVSRFDNILYISCNPQTLIKNLSVICQTHKVEAFAVFDQFPYTPHLECGVKLTKK